MDRNKINAVLIDPSRCMITEVKLDSPTRLAEIYKLLDVQLIDIVRFDRRNNMYIDDEGLLKDNFFFSVRGRKYAGKGLIVGATDPTGHDTDSRVSWFDLSNVTFHGFLKMSDPAFPHRFIEVIDFNEEDSPDV